MFLNVRKHKLNWKLFLIEKTQGGEVFFDNEKSLLLEFMDLNGT